MTTTMTMSNKKTLPVWSSESGFQANKTRAIENRGSGNSSVEEPQDADYDIMRSLSDELETLILARLPRSEHWKLCFLNKRLQALVKTGEIIKIRREIGFKEPTVFMLASGETNWWALDEHFESFRTLPFIPSDYNFTHGDKESFCAGSLLFVSGREFDGAAVWKYEVATNQWLKAPSMNNPRCLFASASSGNYAFVAGGQDAKTYSPVLDSAEKYNSKSKCWESLPGMNRKRKSCSGCYMDNKFYVIGGHDEQQNVLTCGEFFDEKTNTWNLIPDMLKDIPVSASRSPPLVAVANNQLYALDTSSNELKTYLKRSNSWKKLGTVPVVASAQGGWGVAFKSLGNELLVIGATATPSCRRGLTIYTCCPDPSVEGLQWQRIECGNMKLSPFIHNCAVRVA